MNPRLAITLVAVLSLGALAAALLLPPMAQPLDYHEFVDTRAFWGVPNFLDVASNLGFLLAGLLGLQLCLSGGGSFATPAERVPYTVFFLGALLTAFGSGYYHLAPDNASLFWDRLPMTIAFMSLICAQVMDRIQLRLGLYLLAPALLLGMASVIYWRLTEAAGVGNVLPYGILQGYTIVLLLLLALAFPSRYSHGHYILLVFAWYVLAKAFEFFDAAIYAAGGLISGHSLKHVAASMGGFYVYLMLRRRSLQG